MAMTDFTTQHTRDTARAQTYFQHLRVALWASLRLFGFALGGIWHAFVPEHKRFQFWTSSGVIQIYKELEFSGRHDDEIEEIFSTDRRRFIQQNRGS